MIAFNDHHAPRVDAEQFQGAFKQAGRVNKWSDRGGACAWLSLFLLAEHLATRMLEGVYPCRCCEISSS